MNGWAALAVFAARPLLYIYCRRRRSTCMRDVLTSELYPNMSVYTFQAISEEL